MRIKNFCDYENADLPETRDSYQSLEIPSTTVLLSRLWLITVDRSSTLGSTSEGDLWSRREHHNGKKIPQAFWVHRNLTTAMSLQWILIITASVQAFHQDLKLYSGLPCSPPSAVYNDFPPKFRRSLHRTICSRKTCPFPGCDVTHRGLKGQPW